MANSIPQKAELVGKVQSLYMYPVKSMGGIEIQQAEALSTGLSSGGVHDRQFAVVSTSDQIVQCGTFNGHELVKIKPSIDDGALMLSFKDQPDISVPVKKDYSIDDLSSVRFITEEMNVLDCGDEVGEWIDEALGAAHGTNRLVYHPMAEKHRSGYDCPEPWKDNCKDGDELMFQHFHGCHVITEGSVIDINNKLADKYDDPPHIEALHFRPNIVVEGPVAYMEDYWEELFIGDTVKFRSAGHKDRCNMTSVDLKTGKGFQKGEPRRTLNQYRPKRLAYTYGGITMPTAAVLGMNMNTEVTGTIQVGDPVYAVVNDDMFDKIGHYEQGE